MWLLERLYGAGDQPVPRFAVQSTTNWMRALAITCQDSGFSDAELKAKYRGVSRRAANTDADTLAFECLLMSMNYVCAVGALAQSTNAYDSIKPAIVSWYYAVYYSSKAMIAASTGSDPQTHAKTARVWQADLVSRNLIQNPFDLFVTNLTPSNIKATIQSLRSRNQHALVEEPTDTTEAWGAICGYLSGTSDYEKWKIEERVKSSTDFKNGGFTNFRTNAAKSLRDNKLVPATTNFLTQAFRYRGKANYRDAIYLSYGASFEAALLQCHKDLEFVSLSFTEMAAHYVSRRVDKDDWVEFCKDINKNAKFNLPFDLTKI